MLLFIIYYLFDESIVIIGCHKK